MPGISYGGSQTEDAGIAGYPHSGQGDPSGVKPRDVTAARNQGQARRAVTQPMRVAPGLAGIARRAPAPITALNPVATFNNTANAPNSEPPLIRM